MKLETLMFCLLIRNKFRHLIAMHSCININNFFSHRNKLKHTEKQEKERTLQE
jgi:hypothetical protein